MEVLKLRADENAYQTIVPVNESDWEYFEPLDGRPVRGQWRPVPVEFLREKPRDWKKPKGDFPSLATHVPVFSRRALDELREFLEPSGELLPLVCDEGDYWAHNVTLVLDALDVGASAVRRFSSGRVMDIDTYVFRADRLENAVVFKLPETTRMDVFVTRSFVDRVGMSGLEGFLFLPVWGT